MTLPPLVEFLILLLGLGLLIYVAMRGFGVIVMAPVIAMIIAILSGMNILPAYLTTFMGGAVNYIKNYFPMFLGGAILGRIMQDSGAAESIARWIIRKIGVRFAMLSVVLACAVLTYGGVSLFVVVFTMFPLGMALFKEANIPKHLLAGAIALGSFSFTMAAFPGSPQIQNIIPTKYFGTDAMAAPITGIIAGLVMWGIGQWYLEKMVVKYKKQGKGFIPGPNDYIPPEGADLPNPLLSVLPLLLTIILLNVVKFDVTFALIGGILLALAFFWKRVVSKVKTLEQGASEATIAMFNTASVVGFGAVVAASPGFAVLKDIVLGIPGNPLISLAVSANVLAGVSGSASGGLTIALDALAKNYLAMGVNPQLAHRISTIACGALDTLPHNGAIITLFKVVGTTHAESYGDIMWVSIWNQLIANVFAIIVGLFLLGIGSSIL
ncbi:MAG: GntP family permease [Anaerolineaceae bacterium]|nr:GntP family permease [Anaerolineaceae bacterium]